MSAELDGLKSQAVRLAVNRPIAFTLGVAVGMAIVLSAPKWGAWMGLSLTMIATSERDSLIADATRSQARADTLQKERDDLVAQNATLKAQLAGRGEMKQLCDQWISDIRTKEGALRSLNRKLQNDVDLASPLRPGEGSAASPAIDEDRANIADLNQALASLHGDIDQNCRLAQ